jgi:(p)ppGpp synthase/HD superfamily hydrolase
VADRQVNLRFERGVAMVRRVRLEAGFRLSPDEVERVARAVGEALRLREQAMSDDHDSRYLHPARTVLILMSDADCRDAAVLAAAPFVDGIDDALVAPSEVVGDVAGPAAARLRAAVPLASTHADDTLLEALVAADHDVAVLALAEHLDQVRHLQFRPDLDWRALHAGVERVYVPAAHRICPQLGRRFDRWAEAFRRRLLTC